MLQKCNRIQYHSEYILECIVIQHTSVTGFDTTGHRSDLRKRCGMMSTIQFGSCINNNGDGGGADVVIPVTHDDDPSDAKEKCVTL